MANRAGRVYRELRAELKERWRNSNTPCWSCGQPIDYDGPANAPSSFEYDHALPVSQHPHLELDPSNGRPAHSRCNRTRGTRPVNPGIGQTTEDW